MYRAQENDNLISILSFLLFSLRRRWETQNHEKIVASQGISSFHAWRSLPDGQASSAPFIGGRSGDSCATTRGCLRHRIVRHRWQSGAYSEKKVNYEKEYILPCFLYSVAINSILDCPIAFGT